MPAVHLDHLSFRYSSAVDVIADAALHLGSGWTGVVGANGSGKTTLLRLVLGELVPTGGRVLLDPADAVVVMCRQAVDAIDETISAFASSDTAADHTLRGRLGLDPGDLLRWPSLSPGERKRWQIGSALRRRPDILLLDEPTNHLDGEGRGLLIQSLVRFSGVGLVVSHDRTLLDTLTTATIRLAPGDVSLRSGNYTTAARAWEAEEAERLQRRKTLDAERSRAERRVAEQRRTIDAKNAAFRSKNRTASFKDIDARSAARGSVHASGEKAARRRLATAAAAAQRAAEATERARVTRRKGRDLFVGYEPPPKRDLLSYRGPIAAGDHVLIDEATVAIDRGDRIWIRGRNGVGKSTLLTALIGAAGLPGNRVLWLPQELTPAEGRAALEEARRLPREERGRVMRVVAALGVDPEALLVSDQPSPGEARKLVMAAGLGRSAWLVVLDEPTNHLDLPSIERLESALAAYPGTLLVVTHDEAFARALDLDEWRIGDRTLVTG